ERLGHRRRLRALVDRVDIQEHPERGHDHHGRGDDEGPPPPPEEALLLSGGPRAGTASPVPRGGGLAWAMLAAALVGGDHVRPNLPCDLRHYAQAGMELR